MAEHIYDKNSLCIRGLSLSIRSRGRYYKALENISFHINPGEIAGLVGESGCGKSITSLAIMGLLPPSAKIDRGEIFLGETDLLKLGESELCKIRGEEISMIFQNPMSALNPLITCGKQIEECYTIHHKEASKEEAREKTLEIMRKAGLSRVEQLYKEYPHQLSGGMKQRIIIAMALINHPKLIIADEPTTALDVTIQAQILELLKELNKEFNSMILLISHDLGVIREVCDRTMVMYGGRIVESGETEEILENPVHPYTKGLIASVPSGQDRKKLSCIRGFVESLEKRKKQGCPFAGRCDSKLEKCLIEFPDIKSTDGHKVCCHLTGGGNE